MTGKREKKKLQEVAGAGLTCNLCRNIPPFSTKHSLIRHFGATHGNKGKLCHRCFVGFSTKNDFNRHKKVGKKIKMDEDEDESEDSDIDGALDAAVEA